jgi:lysozyme family protein
MFHGNFEKTKEFNKCSKRQEWKSQVKKDKNGRVTNKKIQVMLLKEDNIILIL